MGEYPLTWSAFLCNEGIYNLLLDKGADPDAQDTYGQFILIYLRGSLSVCIITWYDLK